MGSDRGAVPNSSVVTGTSVRLAGAGGTEQTVDVDAASLVWRLRHREAPTEQVAGQVAGMLIWEQMHELAHRDAARGPRIVKVLNRLFGRWRNHTAVWLTAIVTPVFWLVRVAEIVIYPLITRLVNFPRYRSADWVRVSRHKFDGLVGHDLIWCLYCDWMTGVWSLGTEILRNVESFWCPIRFDSEKKCANCSIDFPDVANGWVPANANIADAAAVVDAKFSGGQQGWFGHPARLTIGGKPIEPLNADVEVP